MDILYDAATKFLILEQFEYQFVISRRRNIRTDSVARMSIRNIKGEKAKHFVTKRTTPHSDFCRLRANQINPTQYDEGQFNIENFMDNLL